MISTAQPSLPFTDRPYEPPPPVLLPAGRPRIVAPPRELSILEWLELGERADVRAEDGRRIRAAMEAKAAGPARVSPDPPDDFAEWRLADRRWRERLAGSRRQLRAAGRLGRRLAVGV